MKIVRNVFLVVLLLYLSFDTISLSNVLSFVHEHPASFMQTNQKKQTKTYGLVGLDEPFRQGRSLSLPTLPFQQTNRYAVVGDIAIHSLSNLVQKASPLILNTRIIVSSCILILLNTYGILSRSHFIIYEFEIRNNI